MFDRINSVIKSIWEYFFPKNVCEIRTSLVALAKVNLELNILDEQIHDALKTTHTYKSGIFIFKRGENYTAKQPTFSMHINYEETMTIESDAILTYYNTQSQKIQATVVPATKIEFTKCQFQPFIEKVEVCPLTPLSAKASEVTFKETLNYKAPDNSGSVLLSYDKTYTCNQSKTTYP